MPSVETQSGFAPIEGTELYYETAGHGEWLVFLHAGIADRRMWEAQWTPFASRFRLLRYDMRGFGRSPMAPGSFSNRQDLFRLLQALKIEQAHFIGCSMGGLTLLDFALEHPEMARSLVLVSAAVSGMPLVGEMPPELFALFEARKSGDFERAADLHVQIWADGFKRGQKKAVAGVRAQVRRMGLEALANQDEFLRATGFLAETPLQPPAFERLESVRQPALVIAGDLDDDYVLLAAEAISSRIPGARKEIIHGAAHLPNMEKPAEFNRLVLGFLNGLVS
jgi:pimeloyl-ACP methyl ester carboxylesterase